MKTMEIFPLENFPLYSIRLKGVYGSQIHLLNFLSGEQYLTFREGYHIILTMFTSIRMDRGEHSESSPDRSYRLLT